MTGSKTPFLLYLLPAMLMLVLSSCSVGNITTKTTVGTSAPENTHTVTVTITHRATYTVTPTPTNTRRATRTPKSTNTRKPTRTPTFTRTRGPTATLHPTKTRWVTSTHASAFVPQSDPVYIGTTIPGARKPIQVGNFVNLSHVAVWGKSSILATAFTPDGDYFVAGSMYGIAIYETHNPEKPPRWLPFSVPYFYQNLSFDADGNYLLLEYAEEHQIRSFQDGHVVNPPAETSWLRTSSRVNWNDEILSPDGNLLFKHYTTHPNEENFDIEESVREIHDASTNELLYTLPDETIYVHYDDYNEPEGCDLNSFSMCGNVYSPIAETPYRIAFSPADDTLVVLYRPHGLGNSRWFSFLRIYNANGGNLISTIGGFQQPVENFAYSPDGNHLVVGYVDGTIQLWDIQKSASSFSDRHFQAYIQYLTYSQDGKYLLIQRPNLLEIRRTSDGALRSTYESIAFAISPVDDLLAVADVDNNILIQQIDGGKTVHKIHAHEGTIYALAFSTDGQTLVSSGEDCAIKAWNVNTGEFQHGYEATVVDAYGEGYTNSRIFVKYIKFIPGTNQLVGFGSWATVVNWNINSGSTNYVIESAPLEYYNGMMTLNPHFPESFGVDIENSIFYVGNQGYSLLDGTNLGEYQAPANLALDCYSSGPRSIDGKLLFTRGYDSREGQICLLDANDLHLLQAIEVFPEEVTDYEAIDWLYLSPDGSQLSVSTYSGVIYVYQVTP